MHEKGLNEGHIGDEYFGPFLSPVGTSKGLDDVDMR